MAPATLPEVTSAADIIITVVSDDEAMDDIFGSVGCGSDSLLGTASGVTVAEGRLCLSIARPFRPARMNSWRAARSAAAAQVAGSLHGFQHHPGPLEGTLYLMCGGKTGAFERAKPVLEKLSSSLRYIGGTGSAAKVKALVNMVMNINTAGLAEGLGLADALGLDLAMVREVFSQTGANSRVLVTDGEDM